MANAFTNAIGASVAKAKKTVDTYTQAARDLATAGKTAAGIPAMSQPNAAFGAAEAAEKARKKKQQGY